MSTVLPLLDNVIENLKALTETIVVKYSNEAAKDETLEKTKAFDYYYLALNKRDTFDTYPRYCEEALISAGVLDPEMLRKFMNDRKLIPASIRNRVLEAQRFIIVRDFEELNNYYRTFIGLPSTDDEEKFFVDEDTHETTGIPMDVPIHELDDIDISKLQATGFMSRLMKKRPDKTYLKYIGKNRLDLYLLRTAKNLSIINVNKQSVPDTLFRDFMLAYEQCREYFMVAIYIKEYASMHKYYDNIIGFMVMVSTIRRIMTNIFKNGIDRDFYDLPSIIKMLEAYQVPFIQDYTLEQHRIILRNINNLIRIKATDRVLIDLVALLGFSDVNIYKYYLVKSHKLDTHGNPIFRYKDEPGRGRVLDYKNMYNISFSRVDFYEKNIGSAITNSSNRISYQKVTDSDPFWWEDDDLKNTIYENEFNYLETKYISFEIIYKMSKVVFETVYFLSMLHDRKSDTSNVEIYFNKIDYAKPINLFDICIFLFAVTAKKQGLKGEIIHDPTKVGHVLGFNFKADLKPIIDQINNDPALRDPELVNFISDMSITSIDDIDNLYRNIKGFKDYIEEKIFYTQDKETYYKYQTIYKTLMTTEYMGELFRLPDGDIASTYKEYLMYTNYELYEYLESLEIEVIDEITLHIVTKIEEYCESLKYIHQTADGFNVNASALMSLVTFFKSYTVDIEQFNIIYVIDSRMDNLVKFLDRVGTESHNTLVQSQDIYDTLNHTSNIYGENEFGFKCRTQSHIYMCIDDKFVVVNIMDDKIQQIVVNVIHTDHIEPHCIINQLDMRTDFSDSFISHELHNFVTSYRLSSAIDTKDNYSNTNTIVVTGEDIDLKDSEYIAVEMFAGKDSIDTKDKDRITTFITTAEHIELVNKISSQLKTYINENSYLFFDSYGVTNVHHERSELRMHDKLKIVYN